MLVGSYWHLFNIRRLTQQFGQMTAARRSTGRQFILITPGTKTDITIAPDVRVKELAEPERGQTTLSFQRR